MKNNKTILLALLIWAGSALAMAAEAQHDAHDKAAAVHKLDEHAAAVPAKIEVPVLADAPAKPVMQKKPVPKKVRVAKKPVAVIKSDDAKAAQDKPTAAPAAAPTAAHSDAHGDGNTDSHAPAAASQPAVVSNNSARPRNRVSIGASSKDIHAVAAVDAPDAVHADAHGAAIAPVKNVPVLEAVPATEIQSSPAISEGVKAEACSPPSRAEIAALFDRWNAALKTGDAKKVVANYATPSILLPTVSNQARFTAAEKEDYFVHFLARKPEGSIDDRMIEVDCNSASDAGLYSFKFGDGSVVKARYSFAYKKVGDEWLIASHHSSAMPEKTVVADKHAEAVMAPDRNEAPAKNGSWIRFP